MRLIDADALQRRICGAKCGCEYEGCGMEGDCEFDHFILHAPTIDVENFVRYHIDEISRTIRYQLVEVDAHKPYCPNCGARMNTKDGEL